MIESCNRNYSYRIYPNREQRELINKTFGCTRLVYNYALDFWNNEYDKGHRVNYNSCCKELTSLKTNPKYSFLNEIDSTSLQNAIKDLSNGFNNFFRKDAKHPKFHTKRSNRKSYRSTNNNDSIRVVGNYIKLPKLGVVKAKISRPIDGKIYNATIEITPSGKYFCIISILKEIDIPTRYDDTSIGIDVGIKYFYEDSNAYISENPHFLKLYEKKLIREQRSLSRSHSRSKRFDKKRLKLTRTYEKITNLKEDFLNKEVLNIVRENQTICIENLNVKGMVRNHHLAKAICEVSWSRFFQKLEYKAYEYGSKVIKVPQNFASSQTCSNCGKNPGVKDLKIRNWVCPLCGKELDRDLNAAINIKNKGLEMLKVS